jgi:hypothetical protein
LTGWQPTVQETVSADTVPGGFQKVSLKRREFEVGNLIHGVWDDDGAPVTPIIPFNHTAPRPLLARIWNRLIPTAAIPTKSFNAYQFQVLMTGEFPLGEVEQEELLEFFLDARDVLRRRFTTATPAAIHQLTSDSTDH